MLLASLSNPTGTSIHPEQMRAIVEFVRSQGGVTVASTIAQHAALACFEPESIAEYERRRAEFRARRDCIVPAFNELDPQAAVPADGAFYADADCSAHSPSSWDFCMDMMNRAHVALTPGRDFGRHDPDRWLRLSFASSRAQLEQAVQRLQREL